MGEIRFVEKALISEAYGGSLNDAMKRYPLQNWRKSLEDFRPDADEFNPELFGKLMRVATRMADYFSAELKGAERIPEQGGALLVGNHGPWGIESPALLARIYERTGRVPRALAEHLLIKLPVFGKMLRALGAVDGNPSNALKLLEAGHLVLVYPGGHRDSLKGADQRYKLQWHRSRGYARCAIRAQVPIIPIAGVGIDEALLTVRREHFLGRLLFGRTDYDLPITLALGLLPFPVKFTFRVGEPIAVGVSAHGAEDADVVEALHDRVAQATQRLIDEERGRRFSPVSD